jgi:cytochrome c553
MTMRVPFIASPTAGLDAVLRLSAAAAFVVAATLCFKLAQAETRLTYAERFAQICANCHGANGRSEMADVPVLSGQYSMYAITQLFLYRENRRDHAAMVALARGMSDDDLRGYSDHIGQLPAVPAPPAADTDEQRMRTGSQLAYQYKCSFCHGDDMSGGKFIPRIGGQKEEYLRVTLHGFKTGKRPGYTRAMTEALSQVPEKDLDLLAYYIARIESK